MHLSKVYTYTLGGHNNDEGGYDYEWQQLIAYILKFYYNTTTYINDDFQTDFVT